MSYKVKVSIKGEKPILLHNPAGMGLKKAGKKEIPSPEEEAAASLYWMPGKESIGFPTTGLHRALITVSSQFKSGKQSSTPYVAGCLEFMEEIAGFGTTEYEVDTRRAVVQRQGGAPVTGEAGCGMGIVLHDSCFR